MENRQRLIIRISRNGMAFSASDGVEVKFERYAMKSSISVAANMREALRNMPLLQQSFERVTVMVDSPVMLTPADLYVSEEQEELYRFTFSQQDQQIVLSHVLPDLNTVAVFSIRKDLRNVITDRFGAAVRFRPVMTTVWHHFHQRSYTGSRNKLYAYFHDHCVEVFSFAKNRFRFCNSYAVGSNPDDALFYILSAWKQLGFEAHEDELYLSGDISEREQFVANASKYVKYLFTLNPSGEFNRAAVTQIVGMPYDMMLIYLN